MIIESNTQSPIFARANNNRTKSQLLTVKQHFRISHTRFVRPLGETKWGPLFHHFYKYRRTAPKRTGNIGDGDGGGAPRNHNDEFPKSLVFDHRGGPRLRLAGEFIAGFSPQS